MFIFNLSHIEMQRLRNHLIEQCLSPCLLCAHFSEAIVMFFKKEIKQNPKEHLQISDCKQLDIAVKKPSTSI